MSAQSAAGATGSVASPADAASAKAKAKAAREAEYRKTLFGSEPDMGAVLDASEAFSPVGKATLKTRGGAATFKGVPVTSVRTLLNGGAREHAKHAARAVEATVKASEKEAGSSVTIDTKPAETALGYLREIGANSAAVEVFDEVIAPRL